MPAKSNFEVSINEEAAIPVNGRKEMDTLAKAAMLSGDKVTVYKDGTVDSELTAKYNKRANDAFKSQMFVQLTRRAYQLNSLVKDWNSGMTETALRDELDDIVICLNELRDAVRERTGDSFNSNEDPFEEEVPQTV